MAKAFEMNEKLREMTLYHDCMLKEHLKQPQDILSQLLNPHAALNTLSKPKDGEPPCEKERKSTSCVCVCVNGIVAVEASLEGHEQAIPKMIAAIEINNKERMKDKEVTSQTFF